MEYLVTAVLFLLMTVLYVLWNKSRRQRNWPPGPPTVPFIGNLNIDTSDMVAEFRKLRKQYGDIFSLVLGTQTVVVVNGLENLKEIFIKHGDVTSERPDMFWFREISKHMGFGCSGEMWKTHRAFAVSTLRNLGFGTKGLGEKFQEEEEAFIDSLRRTDGKPFDVSDLLNVVVANNICSVIFGHRYEHEDEHIKKLLNLLPALFNDKATGLFTFLPFLKYIPGDPVGHGRVMETAKTLNEHIQCVIKENRKPLDKNAISNYLDAYWIQQAERGPNSTFTDEQLLYSVQELFVAGMGSTMENMKWLILALLHNPDVQKRMHKEIVDVVGGSRLPLYTDREKLPYCNAVVHETMRFGNVVPHSIPHGLSDDLHLKNYMIPKHAFLVPGLDSILNDPELFPDPYDFNPSRFLADDGSLTGTENVYLGVFGVGRRFCIGESLARMEIFLFSTALVQRFQLLPAEGEPLPSLAEYKMGLARSPLPYMFRAVEYA